MEPKRGNNDLINFNIHDISLKVPTGTTRTGMNKCFCDGIPWAPVSRQTTMQYLHTSYLIAISLTVYFVFEEVL